MNNPAINLSDRSQSSDNIRVQLLQNSPGEGSCYFQEEHTLFVSLSPRPVSYLHTQDGTTHVGVYRKGEILLTPAKTSLFTRWEDDEHCLQIQLNSRFVNKIAEATLDRNPDCLELLPQFQIRDSQLEAVVMMFCHEFQQNNLSNGLYLDSLTNILAVNLLRNYTAKKPTIKVYEGGLTPRQLNRVLDFIDSHLDRNIKLADLAELLGMSTFHFSRLFKQSLNITPHQYLSQQRVERAKQLLKKTDLLITDIALECGFNSHSHLSKQFRQLTNMTPKAYRSS